MSENGYNGVVPDYELGKLTELVEELRATSSSNEKKRILASYPECKELLALIHNPNIQFNITSKNVLKRPDLLDGAVVHINITNLLEDLNDRKITGHKALAAVNSFIWNNKRHEELILNILDKTVKSRIDASLINKVWKGLIPVFKVALAVDYQKQKDKVFFNVQRWFASRKLDGCRCLIRKENGVVTATSRSGKEFHTLSKLTESFNYPDGVYDGEICKIDENGDENFRDIMKEISKKGHTIENPKFKVFDVIAVGDFDKAFSPLKLNDRSSLLRAYHEEVNNKYVDVVTQQLIGDDEHFEQLKAEAKEKGWEGLIIRKDTEYEGKRSNNMLKVKTFFDAEFEVLGTYNGKKRMLYDGIEIEKDCLAGVHIEYKGYPVDVGSGWSDAERLEFCEHPENIVGKVITVQWFEETTNDRGTISLRFPTKKWIHGEKREV